MKSGKRNHSIGPCDVCSFRSLRQRRHGHLSNIFQPLPCRITSTNFKFYPIVVLLKPKNSISFELKYKQCRPDQMTSLEASWSESAVSRNIVRPSKVLSRPPPQVIILIKSIWFPYLVLVSGHHRSIDVINPYKSKYRDVWSGSSWYTSFN